MCNWRQTAPPFVLFCILACKDISQDSAANAVPGAGDGAGYYCHWVGGYKEGHCKVGAQAGVLHAHLY